MGPTRGDEVAARAGRAVAVQADGTPDPTFGDVDGSVQRYRPDGTLDPAFGPAGTGVATAVDGGIARDMALLDDGDVVVVGGTAPAACTTDSCWPGSPRG